MCSVVMDYLFVSVYPIGVTDNADLTERSATNLMLHTSLLHYFSIFVHVLNI